MEVKAGYKQTDVGVIPEDWDVKKLGSCLRRNPDYGINAPGVTYDDALPTYLRITDIDDEGKFSPSPKVSVRHPKTDAYFLEEGDLVFARTGASVGKSYLYQPIDGELVFAGFLIRVKPDEKVLSPAFLAQYVRSKRYWDWVGAMSARSGQPGVNGQEYALLYLPLPPFPEQSAIASALSDSDALISSMQNLIAKKRNIKQGAMQQLLTGKKRLPGFGGEWIPLNMTEKSVLKARIGWQGLTTAEYLDSGRYRLVTGTDFQNGRIDWSSCCFVDESRYAQDRNIQLKHNDILLTKDGTIGKVGYIESLPSPATLNSGVFVIRPKNDGYYPLYFYYVLTSRIFENFLTKLQAGSTISHLYQKDFINFSFMAPELSEQSAIAQVLSDMDAEIEELKQKLAKYRLMKQGMMQELLTGKRRLV